MVRFESRSFEVLLDISVWSNGMDGIDHPAVAVATELTHLLVPSEQEPWGLYPFARDEGAQRLAVPNRLGSGLIPVVYSVAARQAVMAPRPFPTDESASFAAGCNPAELRVWDWDRESVEPLELRLDALVSRRRDRYDEESVLGTFFDSRGALWIAYDVRRGDEMSLHVARTDHRRVEAGSSVVVATSHAGREFIDHGWGFARFLEDDAKVFAIVGRPSGAEDRAFALSVEGDAEPERMGSGVRIERILGRWKHRWVVVVREERLRYVLLCGADTTDRETEPERVAVSEQTARLVLVGGHLVGLCGDAPRAEVAWLEALELGWEDVDGCMALHEAQRSWADVMDFMGPAFSAPVAVRCRDAAALFQLGVREHGFHGVLCKPV